MPVREEAGHIARSLAAVLDQDYPAGRMEVLVVDGMSRDGTRDVVRALAAGQNGSGVRVRLLDNPDRIVPTALNVGIEHAQGDIVVRVDGHTVVPADTVRLLVETLQESGADAAGGVARASGYGYVGEAIALAFRTPFGVGDARFRYSDRAQDVKTAYPIAWKREVFDRVGRFDERFPRVQDADFNWRLVQSGGSIRLDPRVRSEYFSRATLVSLWRQYVRTGAYKARLARKHSGLPSSVQYAPAALTACLAISVALLPVSRLVGALVPALYVAANLASSVWVASRHGWRYLPALPIVFGALHVGWGVGFWVGSARDTVVGWHRPKAERRLGSLARGVLVPVAAAVVLLGSALAFTNLGTWISTADPLDRVNLLVVPSGNTFHRLGGAIELAKAGTADRIWIVEPTGSTRTDDARIARFVRRHGFDPDRVVIIGASASTRQDADVVRRALNDRGGRRAEIAVVTSPWHVARARLTFARVLERDAKVLAWSDQEVYNAERWWAGEANRTMSETAKYLGTMVTVGRLPSSGVGPNVVSLAWALFVAVAAAALTGAVARWLASRLGFVVTPRLWRTDERTVPLLGGLSLLVGAGAGLLALGVPHLGRTAIVTAIGVGALAFVGLFDDIAGLRPKTRLLWAAAAGFAAWGAGLRVEFFGHSANAEVGDAILTILWFAGITHALNILDNIDGGSASVGGASALAIGVIGVFSGQLVVSAAALALAGACLGFLVHNRHPARLFMGDMGALALGFALASLGLGLRPIQDPPLSAAVAVLVLGVPIFDTVLVTVDRVRSHRSISNGGTDHAAHRLVARGLSVKQAVGVLWGGQLALGAAALAVAQAGPLIAWAVLAAVGAAGLVALRLFLSFPIWESGRSTDSGALAAADMHIGMRMLGNGSANGHSTKETASATVVPLRTRAVAEPRR